MRVIDWLRDYYELRADVESRDEAVTFNYLQQTPAESSEDCEPDTITTDPWGIVP